MAMSRMHLWTIADGRAYIEERPSKHLLGPGVDSRREGSSSATLE